MMPSKSFIALTLALAALLSPMTAAPASPKKSVKEAPRTYKIEIKGFQFEPPVLEVNAGDTVIWTNDDIVPHTVTAANGLHSGGIDKGASWSYVAIHKGSFSYICSYHPTMKAQLTVK